MPQRKFRLLALFLLSTALIAYELFIIRVFSVGNWSNFGSLIISTALLGFGISGTLLTFIGERLRKRLDLWTGLAAICFLPAMALAFIIAQRIPFNPMFIGSRSGHILWILVYYLVYGLPFFFGASFIGLSFMSADSGIHRVYFWNMAGSGIGGFLLLFLGYLMPVESLLLPILAIAFAAILVFLSETQGPGLRGLAAQRLPTRQLIAAASVFAASILALFIWGDIRVSEYKSISYVKKYPEAVQIHRGYSPSGEMTVLASPYFHFAPGLSDNAVIELKTLPSQPFWGLYIDGNGPIGIMGGLEREEAAYLDYLPMAAPYQVLDKPDVFIVNLGGGIGAQIAKHKEASSVTIYESNPDMLALLKDDSDVSAFSGNLLKSPGFTVRQGDARAHAASRPASYDLFEVGLIDSVGLSDSGGYAIHENYTYTVEAINEYMRSLRPDGLLSITVWNRLTPPRNVLKLMSTVIEALRIQGVKDPSKRIFMFDLFQSTATILIKNSDFTEGEIYDLEGFIQSRSFRTAWAPGLAARTATSDGKALDFAAIMDTYHKLFVENLELEQNTSFSPNDFYHLAMIDLLENGGKNLQSRYVFDVMPMRDSRPYYSGYLKPLLIPSYLDQVQDISEDWGFLLLLGILAQAILLGFLVILMPVVGRWKTLFNRQKGKGRVILYFASLGLGYMLVEIFLMQRLVFLLADPVYSISIVITSMLVISGLGDLFSQRFSKHRGILVRVACLGIALSMAFYLFGLGPVMNLARSAPIFVRILVSILIIAPAAFCMGMPFPTGLDALREKRPGLLPWAWGMNGGLSVAGSALAWILSVSFGFPPLLWTVIVVYGLVALSWPAIEIAEDGAA